MEVSFDLTLLKLNIILLMTSDRFQMTVIFQGNIYHWLPLVLTSVLSLIFSALCWLLRETKSRPLLGNFGETVMLKDKDKKSFRKFAKIGAANKKQRKNMPKGLKRFGGD